MQKFFPAIVLILAPAFASTFAARLISRLTSRQGWLYRTLSIFTLCQHVKLSGHANPTWHVKPSVN